MESRPDLLRLRTVGEDVQKFKVLRVLIAIEAGMGCLKFGQCRIDDSNGLFGIVHTLEAAGGLRSQGVPVEPFKAWLVKILLDRGKCLGHKIRRRLG